MVKRYLLVLLIILSYVQEGSSQVPFWLRNVPGPGNDEVFDMVSYQTDYYITGYYSNAIAMGSTVLQSIQDGDAFIAKMNRDGEFLWAKSISGVFSERGISISTMNNGNVVVSGHFLGTIFLDGFQLSSNGPQQDIFVACYNPNGDILWVKKYGGLGIDILSDIQVDSQNNILVTGQFIGKIIFGNDTLTSGLFLSNNNPSYDIFLTKLDNQGNVIWSKHGKSNKNNRSGKIAIAPDNSFFLSGNFSDTLNFVNTYQNNSLNMGFLMRFNPNGGVMWFRRIQSSVTEIADIACNQNSVFLTGRYTGIQRFANDSSTSNWQNIEPNARPNKYYIASYNYDGIIQFKKSEGSENEVNVSSIKPISTGGFALSGEFKCFHSDYQAAYGEALFLSRGYEDIFLSKYDQNANRIWAKQLGGIGQDEVNCMSINSFNNPVIGGSFTNSISSPAKQSWGEKLWYQHFTTSDGLAPLNYCGDPEYNFYAVVNALGSKDILVANIADTTRSTMDVFNRNPGSCIQNVTYGDFTLASAASGDACSVDSIQANTVTGNVAINGLSYKYKYNGINSSSNKYPITFSAMHQFEAIANNTCYSFAQSMQIEAYTPVPEIVVTSPGGTFLSISSNPSGCKQMLNRNTSSPVILNGTVPPAGMINEWVLPDGSIVPGNALSLFGPSDEFYTYRITNPLSGCTKAFCTRVRITVPDTLGEVGYGGTGYYNPAKLLFKMGDRLILPGDTIYGCRNDYFDLTLVNTNENPLGDTAHILRYGSWIYSNSNLDFITSEPQYTFDTHTFRYKINTDDINNGNVMIGVYFFNENLSSCLLKITYSVHIIEYPRPDFIYNLSGDFESICPGLIASYNLTTNLNYSFDLNPSLNTIISESPLIFTTIYPQDYLVTLYDTSSAGCADTVQRRFSMSYHQAPTILVTPTDGIVCEGEFVEMTVPGAISTEWFGPTGDTLSTEQLYTTNIAGLYYAVITDSSGCELLTNTKKIRDKSSFGYELSPEFICPGEIAEIKLFVLEGDVITWLPPLGGNNITKSVTNPGTYYFTAPICGQIDTFEVIVPGPENIASIIFSEDTLICPGETMILSSEFTGNVDLFWSLDGLNSDSILITEPGEYSLQLIDENACLTSKIIVITPADGAVIPSNPSSIDFCGLDSLILSVSSGDSVAWYLGTDLFSIDSTFTYLNTYSDSIIFIANYNTQTGCQSERVAYPVVHKQPFTTSIQDTTLQACKNADFTYSFPQAIPGAAFSEWIYIDGSNQTVSTDSVLTINNIQLTNTGHYQLILRGNTEEFCDADTISYFIEMIDIPEINIISDKPAFCDVDTVLFSIAPNNGLSQYLWTAGNQQFMTNTIEATTGMFTGSSAIIEFSAIYENGCTIESTRTLTIGVSPPNPYFTETIIACSTVPITITLPDNQSTLWYWNNNIINSNPQNSFTFTPTINQPGLFIRNNDITGFCASERIQIPIQVKPHINIPDISSMVACPNESITLNFNPNPYNASSFYWKNMINNTILANNANSLTIPSAQTTIGLFALANQNTCGIDSTIFTISLETLPTLLVIQPPLNTVCYENGTFIQVYSSEIVSIEFTLNSDPNPFNFCENCSEYLLYLQGNLQWQLQAGINNLTAKVTTLNNCTFTQTISFNVDWPQSPNLGLEDYRVCIGDTIHIDPIGNNSFDWTNGPYFDYFSNPVLGNPPITTVHAANSNTLNYVVHNGMDQLYVTYINQATLCKSAFQEIPIEIKPDVELPFFQDWGLCAYDSAAIAFSPADELVGEFHWATPTTSMLSDSAFVINASDANSIGLYTLFANASINACGSDTATFLFVSYPVPTVTLVIDSTQVCTGRPFGVNALIENDISSNWYYDNNSSQSNPLYFNLIEFNNDSLSIFGEFTSPYGCIKKDSLRIAVYQTPETPDITVPLTICAQDTVILTLNNILQSNQQFQFQSNVYFGENGNQLLYIPGDQDTVINLLSYITTEHCFSDTLITVLKIHQLPIFNLGNDSLLFCFGIGTQLDGPSGYSSYLWSTGDIMEDIEVLETGTYSLLVTDNQGCLFTDTIFVIGEWPLFQLPNDTIEFCFGDPLLVNAPSGFDFYQWNTGSTENFIKIAETGEYILEITDVNGCSYSDTLYALGGDCDVQDQPNVFTPNGDGFNDKFTINPYGMNSYKMIIHDRWGKFLDNVLSSESGWDGKDLQGELMPEGVYFFVATVDFMNNSSEEIKGMIQLLK